MLVQSLWLIHCLPTKVAPSIVLMTEAMLDTIPTAKGLLRGREAVEKDVFAKRALTKMNWTAGILVFVLVYVPMMVIFYRFHKRNKEIDLEYEQKLERIRKRYSVK